MSSNPELSALLGRIFERYGRISTYRDVGEQEAVMINGPNAWNRSTTKKRFRTLFARPGSFLFECKDVDIGPEAEWQRVAAWQTGGEGASWSWGTIAPLDGPRSLDDSISAIAGVCGPVAKILGACSDCVGTLPDPESWLLTKPEAIDGRVCAVMEGSPRYGHSERFWFDEEDLLLRRIESRMNFDTRAHQLTIDTLISQLAEMREDDPHRGTIAKALQHIQSRRLPDFVVESVTTWHPEVDVAIDASSFEYQVPRT